VENIGRGTIMEKHREYPLAYPPISKVLVKEEPGGRWENVIADSSPLPRSVIQKEPQSGDDAGRASHAEFNSESSSDEDGEECRLVAYPLLPKRTIKEEMDHGASHPEFNSKSRSDEDKEECILVAYPPLPRLIIKEEIEIGDNPDDSGVQQVISCHILEIILYGFLT